MRSDLTSRIRLSWFSAVEGAQDAFALSAHRSSISDTETRATVAVGALTVISAARRCASFFVHARLAQLDRSTLLVSAHEGANLPNARVPFTDSSHVAQRSICRDKVGMKSKFSPVGDGNNPRNYYLSRCSPPRPLYLVGALVDLRDFGVAHESLHRKSLVKPYPPNNCTASVVTLIAVSEANDFAEAPK